MTQTKTNKRTLLASLIVALLLIPCLMLFTACGEKDEAKVDASIAKVDGITVTLNETTKKQFTAKDDSAARFEQFGKYGELDQINIKVSGTVSKADCAKNATAMDATGTPVSESKQPVNYYTDFFQLSLLIPEGATQFATSDGLPAKPVSDIENIKDGYVIENVQWLLADANGENWNICGNATTKDGYFYYQFLDDNNEVVDEFFVHVVYDVDFVA